jgi:hypothetical protein
VALLCGAWAAGETLDEALARLTKAAADTRDLAMKLTLRVARYDTRPGSDKLVKALTASGTWEFQMLRDGGKCLMRAAIDATEERQGKDPAAPLEKHEIRALSVNDGQFLWRQKRSSEGQGEVRVRKESIPVGGGVGADRDSGALHEAPFRTGGIRSVLDQMAQRGDIKLAGKGVVAARPTTIIEVSAKDERREGILRATKVVVQFDDATGAALSGQEMWAMGAEEAAFVATEVRANSGLDKKLFTYTPPEGVKVYDMVQPPTKHAPLPESEKKAP